jgi:glucose-6-phosphate isomerase
MESLGKERDLEGQVVNQGISVYGNKGSTDQHAYVQQLREGVHNFFVTFIRVLKDRDGESMEVEKGHTSGDYLDGFFQGTRNALYQNRRESITINITLINEFNIGALVALFERSVGYYASIININAYHQPGVEAGKKAAGDVITLQAKIIDFLSENSDSSHSVDEIAAAIKDSESKETVFLICQHLSANEYHGVKKIGSGALTKITFQSQ